MNVSIIEPIIGLITKGNVATLRGVPTYTKVFLCCL